MLEWHPNRKRRFRGEILMLLSNRHGAQKSRLNDVQLYRALQTVGVEDAELKDVVTICQEMRGRGWVTYEQLRSPITDREELHRIEICPEGQDIVDQTTKHAAVSFL